MLVGNKSDLKHLRAVPTEDAKQFASNNHNKQWNNEEKKRKEKEKDAKKSVSFFSFVQIFKLNFMLTFTSLTKYTHHIYLAENGLSFIETSALEEVTSQSSKVELAFTGILTGNKKRN